MLPSLSLLEQIPQHILNIPNQRKESKRREHYCCYLLCQKAGLRVSEAVNFDLSAKAKKGLYRLNKTKGKKGRYVYIPQQVISELKKHEWKPKSTNRFNFYHFLKSLKKELRISQNVELTPHTLRRAFATYHAENGLPLPLLSKLLGHQSVRTTALYWMNTYGNDDDDSDTGAILCGKNWLEKQGPDRSEPKSPIINEIPLHPERISLSIEPEKQKIDELTNTLSHYQQQLAKKDKQISELTAEKDTLQSNLEDLNEQNATLCQELSHESKQRKQIQQDLAQANHTIKHLEQELTNEKVKQIATENNLTHEKQSNQSLQETNANLTQKLHTYEQNHTNLTNAYQITLKDKAKAEKQLNHLTKEVKNVVLLLSQWQKINYYQQLEKQNELKAQIIQPPPWKSWKN